jgi:diaminohydroxyphosphoribosylaminopyrimidine deaminase/5-amino-6-(5-phosphoribosylamino)uracil reductase
LDGKVATVNGDSRWITCEAARARAHELRHQSDAIMIGGGTARADDPLLTDRSGLARRRPLVRVVVEQYLHLSPESQLAQTIDAGPVIIFACGDADEEGLSALQTRGVEVILQSSAIDLGSILDELGKRSIQRVLLEGGPSLAGLFLDAGLVNKITFFIAPIIIGGQDAPSAIGGSGVDAIKDALQLERFEVLLRDRDIEITGYPKSRSEG